MATRLYPSSVSAASTSKPALTPAVSAEWEDSTISNFRQWMRSALQRTNRPRGHSGNVQINLNDAVATVQDVLGWQFISHPLAAQTISGTLKGQFLASESATAADARAQVVAKVVSRDGTTVRGVLYAGDTAALANEFVLTTDTNRKFPRGGATAISPVVCQDGDRIVVEIGARFHNLVATAYSVTLSHYPAPANTELPEDETTTTTPRQAWLEFSADLVWAPEAVTVRAKTSATSAGANAGATLSAAKPTTVTGDLLIAAATAQGGSTARVNPITPPAGWSTLRFDVEDSGAPSTSVGSGIFYRWADGTEGAGPYGFVMGTSGAGAQEGAELQILSLTNVNPSDPFDVSALWDPTAATSADHQIPSVTPDQSNGGLLLGVLAANGNIGTYDPPGEMDFTVLNPAATNAHQLVATEWWPAATATGIRSVSHSNSVFAIGQAVVVNSVPPNVAPNAPTLTDKGAFEATAIERFFWAFSDPDAGNTQSAYQLRIIRTSDSAVIYDTGKTVSVNQYHDVPAATLTNGVAYQWEVKTWDQSDVMGPYSTRDAFTPSAKPTTTITTPAANGTTVNTSSLTVAWNYSDPEGSAMSAYKVVLKKGVATISDTGKVLGAATSKLLTGLVNNANDYSVEVTTWDAADLASTVAVRTFVTSFTPPATPTIVVTEI